jgi:hypothetical protein
MTATKALAALRLAQAVPETTENYPVLRELVRSLTDLVALVEVKP